MRFCAFTCTAIAQATILYNEFENYTFIANLIRSNVLKFWTSLGYPWTNWIIEFFGEHENAEIIFPVPLYSFHLHCICVVIKSALASQITSLAIVCSTVYSRRRSKKTSKLRIAGLCEGNSPVTGEFPSQGTINAENVSIWWRHHGLKIQWVKPVHYVLSFHVAGCFKLPGYRCARYLRCYL